MNKMNRTNIRNTIHAILALAAISVGNVSAQGGWTDAGSYLQLTTTGDKVGVGITIPSAKLDVHGSNAFDGSANSPATLFVGRTVSGSMAALGIGYNASHIWHQEVASDGLFSFYYYNGTSWSRPMVMTANSYVGIGTATPQANLDVYGTFRLGVGGNTGGTAQSIGLTRTSGAMLYDAAGAALTLGGDVTGVDMTILANGNIGIGTTNPGPYKLNVTGAFTRFNGLTLGNNDGSNISDDRFYFNWSSGTDACIRVAQNVPLRLQTNNGSSELTLAANGNVGIGITSPTAKLEVAGIIKATAVQINNWTLETPDFVFDKNYALPTLEEVEKQVSAHKHLADVPSAKEMKQKGVDIVKLNMALLRKIEELTLYAIEQNKRIEALEKKVAGEQ